MNTKRTMMPMHYALALAVAALVAGCGGGGGGGGGDGGSPPPSGNNPGTGLTLGGTVNGLGQGATVTLVNGAENLPVAANGPFTFTTRIATGTAFNISATPPNGYTCKVTNGAGTMGSANSTNTTVDCAPVQLAGSIAALQEPQAVTSDSAGNIFVVDGGPHSILKFAPNGTMTTLAGGTAKPGYADGPGASARFHFFGSSDIVSDVQGNLFVSDECNGMIRKLAADGTVSTLAGSGSTFCNNVVPAGGVTTPLDGTGQAARFTRPMRIVPDDAGGVVAIDSLVAGQVRFVSASGVVMTRTYAAPAGLTAAPTFYGIARAKDGTLYLSDFDGRIWKDVNGVLAQVAGHAPGALGSNLGFANGAGPDARFSAITDIVVSPKDGNLYVGDASMVRKVELNRPDGVAIVSTLAGAATRGFVDGTGTAARFTSIRGMGIVGDDLIVIETDQGVLRRVTLGGAVTTLTSTPAVRGSVDGPGPLARFNLQTSLAADGTGSLYMADSIAHTIRKVAPDGTVSTFAGKAGQPGMQDGALAGASFTAPRAVAAGRDGSVWVAQGGVLPGSTLLRRIMGGSVSTVDSTLAVNNLAVDANGNAIVATNGAVTRVTPAGAKTTLVDTARIAALVAAPTTKFVPQSVVLDGAGNIYISDTATVAVYKLTPADELSVFAGTPLKEAGDVDGPVNTATLGFYEVEYMTIDDKGNLYLSGQGSVRMISPSGVVSTPNFAWGKAPIGAVAFANGKLYGMTRYALLQNYLQ